MLINKKKNEFVLEQTPNHSHYCHIQLCDMQHSNTKHLPTQHTQNQVENKEGSKDDQANKVDPRQLKAHRIIHLNRNKEQNQDGAKRADR